MTDEGNKFSPIGWRAWLGWGIAGIILIWAIARTFGLEGEYPFVQLMAYTPYMLVIFTLACVAIAFLRRWAALAVAVVGVIALAIAVVPREFGGPEEAPPGTTIRMLSLNTLRGNADVTRLLEIIEEKDINVLSLQELPVNGVKRLRRRGLQDILPHRVLGIEDKGGGGVYTSFPANGIRPTRTKLRQPRAKIKPPDAIEFEVMSVHPRAPTGPKLTPYWSREISRLPVADEPGPPRVLAGDFNATLDHVKLRDLMDTGYRDVSEVMGDGLLTTWPSKLKWPLPVTIDHFLVEEPIKIRDYDVMKVNNTDHRAIYTELVVPET